MVTYIWFSRLKSFWFPKHVVCLSDKSLQDLSKSKENRKLEIKNQIEEKLRFGPLDEIPPGAKNWELAIQEDSENLL